MTHQATFRHILAVRTDLFGEFLLTIPALRALKESFSGAKVTAIVSPSVVPIAQCVPLIDEVVAAEARARSWRSRIAWARRIRALGADAAVMFNASREFNWSTFLAGVPVRLGYDRKTAFLLTHRIADAKPLGIRHEIESNLLLVEKIGARTGDMSLTLRVPPETAVSAAARAAARPAESPLIAVHPFTSNPSKQWPLERFAQTAVCLLSAGMRVALIGLTQDIRYRVIFAEATARGCVNLINNSTLPELAYVLSRCAVLISCDSGPVHLASCVGTPSVALFRSDIPGKARRWGPVAPSSVVIARPALEDIGVEEVVAAAGDAVMKAGKREKISVG